LLGDYTITRKFRGKLLKIKVINNFREGKVSITLNGKRLDGKLIPLNSMLVNEINEVLVELN